MNKYTVKNAITKNWIEDLETKEKFAEYFCNRYLETLTKKFVGLEKDFFFATSPLSVHRVYEETIQEWLESNKYTSKLPPQVRTEEDIREMRL